ncbi:F-box only 36 [Brachionus plicatilis]|uniref:F-box only 36 n=1 Tax=Brachionus plicatilis TaxID=10195 RepID=A0A3M7RV36_BRAPC|nr:F-box only 36 [Brachionus plicatilis]
MSNSYKNHHHSEKNEFFNVFNELKAKKSNLLSLFDFQNTELINVGAQAPAPSKDYCQLIVNHHYVIFRKWKITLRGDSETRYPTEIKDSFEDFAYDENIEREIKLIFGQELYNYIENIVVKKKLDYLDRMPNNILVMIISKLALEDISKLAQVNNHFRQLCRSDHVWIKLYKQYYTTEITPEMQQLAESSENGWRKLFFTNKLKLQLELRRQAKKSTYDDHVDFPSRRVVNDEARSKTRNAKSVSRYEDDDFKRNSSNNKLRYSTFLTENY